MSEGRALARGAPGVPAQRHVAAVGVDHLRRRARWGELEGLANRGGDYKKKRGVMEQRPSGLRVRSGRAVRFGGKINIFWGQHALLRPGVPCPT